MKQILFILVLCLALTACDDTLHYSKRDTEDKQIEFTYEAADDQWLENQTNYAMLSGLVGNGDFLYFSLGSAPARYNTNSGKISYLCPDPLCFHNNSDCPFFGVSDSGFRAVVKENTIYFPVYYREAEIINNRSIGKTITTSQFRKYEIASGKIETIIDDFSNGGVVAYAVGGDYLYCWHQEKNDDEPVRYYINQYNLKKDTNNEKWLIAAMDGTQLYNLVSADSRMLYLSNYSEGCLYSVPHSNAAELNILYSTPDGFVIDHTAYYNGAFVFIEKNTANTDCRLMRYDVIDNTVSVVQVFDITPNYLYYTEKYAYYTLDKTKEIGKFKETGENLKLSDTVIYRLDYTSDTPVPEKVFEFPAEMSTYSMDRFVVSGNYLYGYYVTWGTLKEVYTSDDGYNSKDDDIIMRIDLRNGEIYYIEE